MARIGFIGLGIMGSGMARNLAAAGHQVTGWNRTRANVPDGLDRVTITDTIEAAVRDAEFVFISVIGPPAQLDVVFDDDGLLEHTPEGALVIDTTSTAPDLTRSLYEDFAEHGADYVDAPVFGSRDEAWGGKLDWLFGGTPDQFARAEPLLRAMGKSVTHTGPLGTAAAMKLAGNLMVAAQFISLAEGLAIARRAGVPDEVIPKVLDQVDFGSGLLRANARSALAGDFTPFFYLRHMLKDTHLVADLAREHGVPVAGVPAAIGALTAAVNAGYGDDNASAVVAWLEQVSSPED
jgi:3-hydroxyisobutyrate dehydrogenase-like beta-hydroxyacid dehydrogenase